MGDPKYVKAIVAFNERQSKILQQAFDHFNQGTQLGLSRSQFLTYLAAQYNKENQQHGNN